MTAERTESETESTPPPKPLIKRLIYVVNRMLLTLLCLFLLTEVILRVFNVRPERYPYPKWLIQNRDGEFVECRKGGTKRQFVIAGQNVEMGHYLPGTKIKVVFGNRSGGYDEDSGVVMGINSHRFRGPESSVEKESGTIRILGLGDSIGFGEGVADDETFLHRLESSLNRKKPKTPEFADARFEVLNVCVQGYNTQYEVLLLEHRWLEFKPDVLLITFYLNDAYSDEAFLIRGQGLGIYLTEPKGLGRFSRLYDLAQHAHRCQLMREEVNDYYAQDFFTKPAEYFASPASRHVDWHESRRALKRAKELADEHDMKIAVAIFPELHQLDNYPFDALHKVVADACRSEGIEVLDLIDVFRGKSERELWCHPSNHHPNSLAHEIAARAIDEFFRQQILVAE